ncbi:MAG TPA: hypothetical protein VF851_06995 [Steroidobacteraceae bacterium]
MSPLQTCSVPSEPTWRWANSGGPMSRRRTERVVASVLREDASRIRFPQVIRAGLHFGDEDPLQAVLESLARLGMDDAEQLRERFQAPAAPLLVRTVPDARWGVRIGQGSDESILRQALLLGLCTPWQYDPSRPVLWTRASLTRRVELYEPAGFYA